MCLGAYVEGVPKIEHPRIDQFKINNNSTFLKIKKKYVYLFAIGALSILFMWQIWFNSLE